jgi:glucose 1-dehydrogenase
VNGLRGRTALVTGGSSGIGQAIAIRLGEEGVDVAIDYVGAPQGAEETKEAIEHGVQLCMEEKAAAGTHPVLVAADVSQEDQVAAMFEQVLGEYGRLDHLVDNAGIQIAGDTNELPVAAFDEVLAVDLRGAFLCAQQAIRHWLATGWTAVRRARRRVPGRRRRPWLRATARRARGAGWSSAARRGGPTRPAPPCCPR